MSLFKIIVCISCLGNKKSSNKPQNKSGKLVSQSTKTNQRNGSNRNRPTGNRKNQGRNNNRNKGSQRNKSAKQGQNNEKQSACPGGSLQACVNDCVPLEQLVAYTACVRVCGNRCDE